MNYLYHLLIISALFGLLAAALDILVGRLGLLSLCVAALFGVGAYGSALAQVHMHWSFPFGIAASVVAGVVASLALFGLSLRLREDGFAIATFAFQILIGHALTNWTSVTGGPDGVAAIPAPRLLAWSADTPQRFFLLTIGIVALLFLFLRVVHQSPFGRMLIAIRESESLVRSVGKEPEFFKFKAFGISGAIAGLSGGLYSNYASYIDPGAFTLNDSILVLAMVVVGGAGSLTGPWIGAAILTFLPELLRFVGIPESIAASTRQLAYGVCLITLMLWRPRRLIGLSKFERKRD